MGKVTDQINQFTETYTSIVVGMHSDINQYQREVKALQSKNIDLELNLYKILNDAKRMEQSNLQTAENALKLKGVKTGHNKGEIDKTAAAIFLQEFLDSK